MGTRGDRVFLLINTILSYGYIGPSGNGKDRPTRKGIRRSLLRGAANFFYITIIYTMFIII